MNNFDTDCLCMLHVIWTGCRMSKLVLYVKYCYCYYFLTAAEFYNLGHIQGIIRVHYLKGDYFLVICTTFKSDFHVG